MAGGTHIFDMIKRLRENENLRKKNYFKSKNTYSEKPGPIHDDFTASGTKREQIRREIKMERARGIRKSIFVFVLSMVLTGVLIVLGFWILKLIL